MNLQLEKRYEEVTNFFKSFLLTAVCYFMSVGLYSTFEIRFIQLLVIAPINEEIFKQYAIRKGYPYIFIFVFSMIEFLLYVYIFWQPEDMVMNYIFMVKRSFVVYFHFTTIYIQKYFYDKNKKFAMVGLAIAIILHSVYNISSN